MITRKQNDLMKAAIAKFNAAFEPELPLMFPLHESVVPLIIALCHARFHDELAEEFRIAAGLNELQPA